MPECICCGDRNDDILALCDKCYFHYRSEYPCPDKSCSGCAKTSVTHTCYKGMTERIATLESILSISQTEVQRLTKRLEEVEDEFLRYRRGW